ADRPERRPAPQLHRELLRRRLGQPPGVPRHGQQRPAGAGGRGPDRGRGRTALGQGAVVNPGTKKGRPPGRRAPTMVINWGIAGVWIGLALLASLISIRFGLSAALVEILVGIVASNLAHLLAHFFGPPWELKATEWIAFLAGFGSILLTF